MTPRFAQRMETVQPSAIRELLALGADPSIISFGAATPMRHFSLPPSWSGVPRGDPRPRRGGDAIRAL
jgi:hypothetical protein